MCLSLQGNLYIFIVGQSEGTVLRLLQRETGDRESSPVSVLFILEKSLVFRHY